ncbi:hypothetical protein M2351_005628 [Azospirillum canadense]|nr:hypothetical protein [Azospirillum canadense]
MIRARNALPAKDPETVMRLNCGCALVRAAEVGHMTAFAAIVVAVR